MGGLKPHEPTNYGIHLHWLPLMYHSTLKNYTYLAPKKPMMGLQNLKVVHIILGGRMFSYHFLWVTRPRIPLKVMMGSWWTWELLFQAWCCKVSAGGGRNVKGELVPKWMERWENWLQSNLACNKNETLPGLLDNMKICFSVMISPILTNPVRKVLDPAVVYWKSPLLYIGKK